MEFLEREVDHLLFSSIAPSSSRTYSAGFRCYTDFCIAMSIRPFPATETQLLWFVASVRRRLGYKSIKVYLCAIQFESTLAGFPLEMSRFTRLHYALRGVRRLQGNKFTRQPREPITVHHLFKLLDYFETNFSHPDDFMLTSAVLLAFFSLLRSSEYTSKSTKRCDSINTLNFDDIHFERNFNFVQVQISGSKTDPFRVGCALKAWSVKGRLCPVRALKKFILNHPFRTGPLFAYADGTFLTRNRLSRVIKLAIPNTNLDTHSFRIGGASAAAAAGIPDSTIQVMGRWSSNAYRTYLRMPDQMFKSAARLMNYARTITPRWSPEEVNCISWV